MIKSEIKLMIDMQSGESKKIYKIINDLSKKYSTYFKSHTVFILIESDYRILLISSSWIFTILLLVICRRFFIKLLMYFLLILYEYFIQNK